MTEAELEEEHFLRTKCGQSFILKKDESNITAELFLRDFRFSGHLDETVRESHNISDQVDFTCASLVLQFITVNKTLASCAATFSSLSN